MFNVSIPEMLDEWLMVRYESIKPVVRINGELHYLREFSLKEIRETCYLWNVNESVREAVKENELTVLEGHDFACLHRYGYPGYFKPSIGEVLAQIHFNDVFTARAFEIIERPQTTEDFYKDSLTAIMFENGYHISKVRLYR